MNTVSVEADLALRPMLVADLEAVTRLEAQIYPFPWSLGNFRDSLSAGYSCWVMMRAKQIIGYCVVMVGIEELHLLNLSIATAHQRAGLGTRLMQHLLQMARECQARKVLLEVRESNSAARAFYGAHQFQHIAVRRGYYPTEQGREDAIVMELVL